MLFIGEHLAVVGDWDSESVPDDRVPVILAPSRAWGYGWHAPTRVCMELLERYITPGAEMLDIGTGSGILAIAAARLGAVSALGTDITDAILDVARQNAALNNVPVVLAIDTSIPNGHYDLIAANVGMPEFFRSYVNELVSALNPNGVLIGTVSTPNFDEISGLLALAGLSPVESVDIDSDALWGFVVRKEPA